MCSYNIWEGAGLFRCGKTTTSRGRMILCVFTMRRLFGDKVKTAIFKCQTSSRCPGSRAAQSQAEEMKHIVSHSTPPWCDFHMSALSASVAISCYDDDSWGERQCSTQIFNYWIHSLIAIAAFTCWRCCATTQVHKQNLSVIISLSDRIWKSDLLGIKSQISLQLADNWGFGQKCSPWKEQKVRNYKGWADSFHGFLIYRWIFIQL